MTLEELQAQVTALQAAVDNITKPPTDYYTLAKSGEEVDTILDRAKSGGALDEALDGKAVNAFGILTCADLLAWALEQRSSGSFVIDPTVTTTTGLPPAWYTGFFDYGVGGGRLDVTNLTAGVTHINHSSAGVWQGWQQIATADQLPNRNLLINPWFQINQRGQNIYSNNTRGNCFCADMWSVYTASWDAAAKKLTALQNFGRIVQSIEGNDLVGKTVTFSAKVSNVTDGKLGIMAGPGDYGHAQVSKGYSGIVSTTLTVKDPGNEKIVFSIYLDTAGASAIIECVKLEIGTVSTLANDPPADYGEELAKCQRYAMAYGQYAQWISTDIQPDYIDFGISLPQNLRTTPSIINIQNIGISGGDGFTLHVAAYSGNNIRMRAYKPSHGMSSYAILECTGIVVFSADL